MSPATPNITNFEEVISLDSGYTIACSEIPIPQAQSELECIELEQNNELQQKKAREQIDTNFYKMFVIIIGTAIGLVGLYVISSAIQNIYAACKNARQ